MRVLGFDPGTATTGYGVVEAQGTRLTHVAHGAIRTPAGHPFAARLKMLHDEAARLLASLRAGSRGHREALLLPQRDHGHRRRPGTGRAGARGGAGRASHRRIQPARGQERRCRLRQGRQAPSATRWSRCSSISMPSPGPTMPRTRLPWPFAKSTRGRSLPNRKGALPDGFCPKRQAAGSRPPSKTPAAS